LECLHCDGGWRTFSFLKIVTDVGITGWSEYIDRYRPGVTGTIQGLGSNLIGRDPRPVTVLIDYLRGFTRESDGGVTQWAVAAIENALVDIKAKHLGISVAELLGGVYREHIDLYWSHCAFTRAHHPDRALEWVGKPGLRSLDDLSAHVREVRSRGFAALKTNVIRFADGRPFVYLPGFNAPEGRIDRRVDSDLVDGLTKQLRIIAEAGEGEVDIHLDLNFNFRTEGFITIARALEPFGLAWLEIDSPSAEALAVVRRSSSCRIASGETLLHRRQFLPYFQLQAMDVAIIDVTWNGILESVRIAALADLYEMNVAPHNFNGHLGSLMAAHFCAAIPNFQTMENDVEDVPWKDSLVSLPPRIQNGKLVLPSGLGWGAEVNEEAVRAHPPRIAGER
jgi:L-alanine-DL-glutamate epimerase-like enolase superfamily enzyme